jgi:hypothetical protein
MVLLLVGLIAVAMTGPRYVSARALSPILMPDPNPGDTCPGCAAALVSGGGSGYTEGYDIQNNNPSRYLIQASLAKKDGRCTWQPPPPPGKGLVCAAKYGCEFTPWYSCVDLQGGNFHASATPCQLSSAGTGGTTNTIGNLPVIPCSCNSSTCTANVGFYTTHDCQSGSTIGTVHYAGMCASCTGGNS